MHQEQASGLHNVWLRNGYELGFAGAVRYRDPGGLVRAIALELCQSPHRLAPEGVHFLRRLLERTQEELDAALAVPPGTVAACEMGTEALAPDRSRMLRLLAVEALLPGALTPEVPEQALEPAQRLVFEHVHGHWHCCERVTAPALLAPGPGNDARGGRRRHSAP